VNVHIITDEPDKFSEQDCRRMLAPWSAWAKIGVCRELPSPVNADALRGMGMAAGDILLAVSKEYGELQKAAAKLGAQIIVPEFPPMGTFDNDLVREVSFFDHEFGGVNEWDGAPTRYAINCIQQMSTANCRNYYPAWAFELLPKSIPRPLKVMDIGCGPVSMLRWGAIHGEISITGLDPLIEMYTLVLARHGLDALQRMRCDQEVNGVAEDMETLLKGQKFDLIYTQNALDHTQQPALVVENVSRHLAPNGLFAVQVATREGTRQKWDQLHKTDIYLKNGVVMYARQNAAEQPLLPKSMRLKHVQTDTPEWLALVIEKV
ncbi:MAG TPA: class I SAM-dependent methyltransferase, partial [Lacipirellulaceae bacterium]|nr:class I SAM-dependent methyltransferase [Lacipirellulaceae bacterium]